MVFVAVGTQKQQFTRLFKEIEQSKILKNEEIIAQSGFTKYDSERIKMLDFIEQEVLNNYIKDSEFVICHGGVGTIFTALRYEKKVLVVPRLKKFKEHASDHQLEISKELSKEGFILYLEDGENLDKKIEELKKSNLKKYKSDDRYLKILEEEI